MEQSVGTRDRIAVPAPVQPRQPHPFPLIATIAPVVVSGGIWLVTQSPFALVFAALGPAVAVASVADARIQARRHLRTERARFARELALSREQLAALHERERRDLDLDAPSAAARLARDDHDPQRWTSTIESARLTLGRGTTASRIDLDIAPGYGEEQQALVELAVEAHELRDAAISSQLGGGVAVVGPMTIAAAVARGLIVQLAALLPPATTTLAVPDLPDGHWVRTLPHRRASDELVAASEVRFRSAGAECSILVATDLSQVPSTIQVVLAVGSECVVLRHPHRSLCGPFEPEFVSSEQALAWANRLRTLAGDAGDATTAVVPERVALAELASLPHLPGALRAPIGVGSAGPVTVDLAADGPHAIVGGTTGSGKSELLIAWVLALALRYSPDDVTFLLVDFKGGASFAPLEGLPHVVGVISDLDEQAASRALQSLEAEVRFRERALAAAGVRSIDDGGSGLARLVIIVDEYASLVSGFPELHQVFSDLAARGRSLGMHLVLCTQRPAGVVRDAVLANSGLRISLRVNNAADSRAVIGTDAAAALPAKCSGRALIAVAGEPPLEVQVPLADTEDCAAAATRWPGTAPRRPWRDPLPAHIPLEGLTVDAGFPFGVADHPHEQLQPVAAWDPERHGHLLVVGAARSGKSSALSTLAATSAGLLIAADAEAAWDAVHRTLRQLRRGGGDRVLLIDDVDALVARLSDDHAAAFVDTLALVLREGPAAGVHVALATQRLVPAVNQIASLCDSRLLLRLANRQDHVIAGGTSDTFVANAVPGFGLWQGRPVQVAETGVSLERFLADEPEPMPRGTVAVVTSAPAEFAERSRAAGRAVVELGVGTGDPRELVVGGSDRVIIGDPDAWSAHWGALGAVAASTPIVFDRCSTADFRALTKSRVLPPPIVTRRELGILLRPSRGAVRVVCR